MYICSGYKLTSTRVRAPLMAVSIRFIPPPQCVRLSWLFLFSFFFLLKINIYSQFQHKHSRQRPAAFSAAATHYQQAESTIMQKMYLARELQQTHACIHTICMYIRVARRFHTHRGADCRSNSLIFQPKAELLNVRRHKKIIFPIRIVPK